MRVAVVGGGIAGVSVAFEVAGFAEVTLLEQERQLAHHTTGRSAAMYLGSYGSQTVRSLTRASRPWFDAIAADHGAVPFLVPRPLLWAAFDPAGDAVLEVLEAAAVPGSEGISVDEAVGHCPVLRGDRLRRAVIDHTAHEIDVLGLHQAYVRGLAARGGVVHRGEPVTRVAREGSGWVVVTPARRLAADVVVDAAGAWADEVARLAGFSPVGLHPLRRTLFTSPAADHDVGGWPLVCDAAERFYFKPEGHRQLLVSPADEAPSEPCDARPEELDVARAIEVVNEHTTLGLRSVRTAWAGLRTFAADRDPVVGERPGEEGFFWFAGQGGYGIQMAPALARAAAGLLRNGRLPDDVAAEDVDPAALAPDRPGLTGSLVRH